MLSTQQEKKLQVGLIKVNDDEERNGGQAGSLWLPAIGTNPGIQMLGSNECDVSY